MTSEVVVMNRMGVALAADSAVTLDMGDSSKVRDSALKLFMLSKYHPVGVMVYNNAQLLGVPLETIIKLFRRHLGRRGSDTLREYGDELISFLDGNNTLFPDAVQTRYFLNALEAEFRRIGEQVREEIVAEGLYGEDATNAVEKVITERLDFWQQQKDAKYLDVSAEDAVGRLSGEVSKVVGQAAANWPPGSSDVVVNLYQIARHLIGKDHFPPDVLSGLVIAGFGEAEHFPVVMKVEIGGVYGGRLKVRPPSLVPVTDERPSDVMAFAYTDMVNAFLDGISPKVLSHVEDAATFIREMPPLALDAVADLSRAEKVTAADTIREASREKAAEFSEKVVQGANDRYNKIVRAVGTLTIGELAQVASTLVGLSSFEQQMSLERQTVGGPVDVAVISKGDGFIWIDRKHYFRRDLNEHFFRRYCDDAPAADDAVDDEKEEAQNGE